LIELLAAGLWGKAAQRSLGRSAFVETIAQVNHALAQISSVSATPPMRRQQIECHIALAYALMSTKGMAAPETIAALEQGRTFIERADALGEPVGNPQQLLVLNGFWLANHVAFNGDALRELAARFLALAETHRAIIPLIRGHRLMGVSLMWTGDVVEGRAHFDRAVALCEHADRPLATQTGDLWVYTLSDLRLYTLSDRSMTLWTLGYPEAALADAQRVAKEAGDLAYALATTSRACILCGNYAAASAQLDEAIASTEEKGAAFWKALAELSKGSVLTATGKPSDAVQILTTGLAAWRSMSSTAALPMYLSDLATAYQDNGEFYRAQHCIDEAIMVVKATKETIYEAEIYRIAGEIALKLPQPNASKAETQFERALAVARQQQAKSWELRVAMSLARLWRDQGKVEQARELLAPVYGWFTEGFDTRDLKEAKALLEELTA
jgi:tetratricopeptide (TPR) repeat protein